MDKTELYEDLLKRLHSLLEGETDPIANMANVASEIHFTFHFWWTGFYRAVGSQLVLGPFQGPVACTRIPKGRGVCGTCWERDATIVVSDVEKFEGHIACSSLSRSEIVIPLHSNGKFVGVLDIDSEKLAAFDETDKVYLEKVAALL